MEPIFKDTVTQIKGKWETINFHSRLPIFEQIDHPIELCYRQGRDAWEKHIREKLLPELEDVSKEERRRYRLHRRDIRYSYCVEGEMVKEHYLSLTLTIGQTTHTGNTQSKSHRVWNIKKNCLCPIECFLSHSLAKKYHCWEYNLQEDRLWVFPRSGGAGKWIEWKEKL